MAEPITISDNDYRTFVRLNDIAGKYGGPDGLQSKISKLEEDAATFRTKSKDLESRVPAEGSTVLTPDEVRRWTAFNALGKTPEEIAAGTLLTPEESKRWEALAALEVKPEDIPALVEENKDLKDKDKRRTWDDGVAALAKAEGIPEDSVPALSAILRTLDAGAVVEVKKEKVKDSAGAEVEKAVGYVTLAGKQAAKFADLRAETAELKGIRVESGESDKDPGNRYMAQVPRGTPGGYDPVKAGKAMAEAQKATGGTANLALT